VRGPARWIERFRLLKWFSLAVAVLLAITGRWGLGAAALLLALVAFSNVWNLGRFIRAQTDPEFRIKEYR
jgi:hypothetical protein